MEGAGNVVIAPQSNYDAHVLVDGFPGRSSSHGSFGWSSVHLLVDGHRRVLVETGPPAYIPLITAGLARYGLSRTDVTDVLVTHAHWDHLGNIAMFPRARVWMGPDEIEWARRLPLDEPFISHPHLRELERRGIEPAVDGDEILPGVVAIGTPGHTPGHVAYVARTSEGPTIFAGDAVKNLYELATGDVDSTLDRQASSASVGRLREYLTDHGATLVPGHDVPLAMCNGTVVRMRPQRARITFVANAGSSGVDRSISDADP
jgi:glyoxylase-like metal-dependent hydrolase (beta-lactamase superfamily II)